VTDPKEKAEIARLKSIVTRQFILLKKADRIIRHYRTDEDIDRLVDEWLCETGGPTDLTLDRQRL